MGIIDTLRKYCIMKSVRDKSKEKFDSNDKYEKLKFKYLEISVSKYSMSTTTEDIDEMKKDGRKNIDTCIKNSKKKDYGKLVSMCEDVKNTKRELRANENRWSRWGKYGEKGKFVYSEYDRLINYLKEEIEKQKPSEEK